ncbi:MAG TPA: GNAT family N-acetyltransferase [Gaiellaceae bacterium]|jgi:RimJ/RimL family protein N-acetyltransferase|nr:GNAT family N-acetyltransferase [Gaiellaceae bacterium]
MPSAAELTDGDLALRPWLDEHAAEVGYTPRDPEIGAYFGAPFDGFPEPDPEAPAWAIVEHGVAVGRLWTAPHKRPFEVGYFLRPDAWGRGLATRSLILVRDWFGEPLALCTHPLNERSQRVAERAGFRRDGVVERYARFRDGETTALRFVWP